MLIDKETIKTQVYPFVGSDRVGSLRRDNFKKVSANGVIYNSLNEAATALGVAANTLTWRCQKY